MKNFEYYKMLPDGLSQEKIESEIEEIINLSNLDFNVALPCIYELSDRQVINYSSIDENLKERIVTILVGKWASLSVDHRSMCMEVMLNFGLQRFYDFLKKEITNSMDADTVREFLEIADEFGDNIEDVSFRN